MNDKNPTKQEAKERIEQLKKLIKKYRYSRLTLDKPLAEEQVEDSLKKELFDLEQQYPDLITPDSPSQRVGGKPLDKFEKFKHPRPMLSFNDAFNQNDMEDWQDRIARVLNVEIPKDGHARSNFAEQKLGGYYCELKLDGLAIELVYKDGKLEVGSTRGDGLVGENVTQNLKTIESIPLSLIADPNNKEVVVRGEVFINKKDFEKINKKYEKEVKKTYANPRNLAAGSVRQLNSKITAERNLDFFAYDLITDFGQKTHEDKHDILKNMGFPTNPNNKFCKNLKEVQTFRDQWEKQKEKLPYQIDGVVVQINDNKLFEKLGVVGKSPRAAIAYKFSPEHGTTKVKDIIISVGRTGTLTPVAILEPVEIGGTTVSRATLHNEDEIDRLGIKIGDTVVVGRAGDVIPDILEVIKDLRTGKEKTFRFPEQCPICGNKTERAKGEAAHKCVNKNCPAIKRRGMYHFVSRGALDIEGLGPKIIDQLLDAGLIKDSADLYNLKKEDLLNLERFAEKSAENTINAIQDRKKIPLDRFIYALGIPNVGSETALDLARKYGTLEKLSKANFEELEKIKDIGNVVAKSIDNWFTDPYHKNLLNKFKESGVKALEQKTSQKSSKLKDLTFVFTGTLESITREDAEELARENGGNTSSSVSKATDYLVTGESPGSKYDKAQKLGIKIISEEEFIKLLK
ncbi:MAG: hypothetical protein COV29_04025 [Candidatus Yanofskybacteria bacterium CG10_big_fil_rev_8_21_14_0_10_36_16]|uniref:DNA ligase n=1 Tax=Candidatus Yanofskybacteria bacterium CG10_big_fil_rev_8_21_14_0_10_36_16 TaxID=1975096 RepID=A0A2J0Q6Q3_9BACT|nr:MAG: hypothetical protein COV29_04025 [Candidatus Yanofskybacteria bacterium CG10_big_fil_rev_8_21_14_0_10_36_16]